MNSRFAIRAAVTLIALVSLLPVARLIADWVRIAPMMADPLERTMPRGFDWVQWLDDDGSITAAYVFPQGTAYRAGIRRGDIFYQLEYQQYFNADDVKRAVEGIPPGSYRTYEVLRGDEFVIADVRITRYPTFMYPLSGALWQASVWGFTIGAFFHLLALMIVSPLALRSRKAYMSLLLIVASSVWVFGNLSRLLLVSFFGPGDAAGPRFDESYQFLTIVSLSGWIAFPAVLLHKVINDLPRATSEVPWIRPIIYLPTVILGSAALLTTVGGSIGPITLDSLIAPILFHVCFYIAASAGLELLLSRQDTSIPAFSTPSGWSRVGSTTVFVLAALAALSVLGAVPILGSVADTAVGWIIVVLQLFSVAPVILVTFATLKHGRVDQVITHAATYASVLGLIFLVFIGGMTLLDPVIERHDAPVHLVAGLYLVVILFLFERLARPARIYLSNYFATERQRARQRLGRFADRMRSIVDLQKLVHETASAVGSAMDARSASLFVRIPDSSDGWISSAYRPEAPFITQRAINIVWPFIASEGKIWAAGSELNESELNDELSRILMERGMTLAIPITGSHATIGLLLMGPKRRRRAVYNLDDVEILRAVCGQVALAVERLTLVEREKNLVRESAEAHLVALRAQINPHFLFNALNTISAFIEEKPHEAERTLESLASIFRYVLKTGSRTFVTLEEECSLVSHYLSIEQARFGNRLKVEKKVAQHLRSFPVPAFVIQTLVENAVKHGIEKQVGGGTVRIEIGEDGNEAVEVVVYDSGVGIPALFHSEGDGDLTAFFGIGLRNVAARLEQLYGRTDLLRFSSGPEEGTSVSLTLPRPEEQDGVAGTRLTDSHSRA